MKQVTPVTARAIINIIGKPKEHIEKMLKDYIGKLKEDKQVNVIKEDYGEAEETEHKGMFSVFVETEIHFTDVSRLMWFCFDYMPSSIEIVEPEKLEYYGNDFTDFLNDTLSKLHKLDMLTKNFDAENKVLKKNGMTLLKNIIRLSIKQGSVDINLISKESGVPAEQLEKFLNAMEKEGSIKKQGDKYELV